MLGDGCQQTFCFQMFVDNAQQCFALTPQTNFPAQNLNFHWRWRWWDRIQAIFFNLFYSTDLEDAFGQICVKTLKHSVFVLILEKNKIKHHQLFFWQKLDPGILTKGTWTLKKFETVCPDLVNQLSAFYHWPTAPKSFSYPASRKVLDIPG